MSKNISMLRKIGGLGLAGAFVLGAGQAQAVSFDASAMVENTLAVEATQPMNLGTLFAASANSSAVNTLTLTPAGEFDDTGPTAIATSGGDIDAAPSLITLGGQTAAIATVATGEEFTVTLPEGLKDDLAASGNFNTQTAEGNGVVELKHISSDPGIARFYLADFTIGAATTGSNPAIDTDVNKPHVYHFTPGFGVNPVAFGIGATVYTDGSGDRTEYQAGAYEGSFVVEASY